MGIAEGLGEALKWLRNRRGWPQKQLAAAAGITKGMVSGYERGHQKPTLPTVEKILTALGADFCDLHCAFEFVNGRPAAVHELSAHFQPGQARSPKVAARKRPDARSAGPAPHEPGGETPGEPQLSEDVERVLRDTVAGVHQLLRFAFLGTAKPEKPR